MTTNGNDYSYAGVPGYAEIPCQNCGRPVTVTTPFVGCVFCSDCAVGDSGWNDGTEDFYDPRRTVVEK